jgi:hypothetical protein
MRNAKALNRRFKRLSTARSAVRQTACKSNAREGLVHPRVKLYEQMNVYEGLDLSLSVSLSLISRNRRSESPACLAHC